MRVESIAKKFPLLRARSVSCTVVKTSLLYSAGDLPISRPWDEHFRTKPITQINPPKCAANMAGVLAEFAPQSRFLDYYA
jgi:hypothetical protein